MLLTIFSHKDLSLTKKQLDACFKVTTQTDSVHIYNQHHIKKWNISQILEEQMAFCSIPLRGHGNIRAFFLSQMPKEKSGQINLVVNLPFLENSPFTANFSEICGENQVRAFH